MPTNETGLQKNVVKAILKRYTTAWIFHPVGSPYQMTGVPDLLVVVDGLLIGIELKFPRPGESKQHARERTTPGQRVQIQAINRAGGMAGTALTVKESLDIIERGLKYRRDTGDRNED